MSSRRIIRLMGMKTYQGKNADCLKRVGLGLTILLIALGMFVGGPRATYTKDIAGAIDGTVHDMSGAPDVGAVIMVLNTCSGTVLVTKTQPDGSYHASRLAAGRYEVSAMLPGFWRERTVVWLNGPPNQTADFVMRPMPTHGYGEVFYKGFKPGTPFRLLNIRGVVFSNWGEPVGNASVTAKNTKSGEVFRTSASTKGLYRLAHLPRGTYIVTAKANGYESEHLSSYIEYGLDSAVNFELLMSYGDGHGRFTDPCSGK